MTGMKNSERWMTELAEELKCSAANCRCEGTKTFADHPEERYCSDCFRTINRLRIRGVVSK